MFKKIFRTSVFKILAFSTLISASSLISLTMFRLISWQIDNNDTAPKKYMHVPKSRNQTEINYNVHSLPDGDFTKLINLTGFTFHIENSLCQGIHPLYIIVCVFSAPGNAVKRNTIRNTWGREKIEGVLLLFFIAGVDDETLQLELDEEDKIYQDLVQGSFLDAYKNLTYKHIMVLKYIIYYCPNTKFVIKTDDDLFLSLENVLNFLKEVMKEKDFVEQNFMMCFLNEGLPVLRDNSKWHVPFEESPHKFYITYCSGHYIIYTYEAMFRIYREAQRGDYFWIEDYFVTGKLARRVNIMPIALPDFAKLEGDTIDNVLEGNFTNFNENFMCSSDISYDDAYEFYEILQKLKAPNNRLKLMNAHHFNHKNFLDKQIVNYTRK